MRIAILLAVALVPSLAGSAVSAPSPAVLHLIGPGNLDVTLPAGRVQVELPQGRRTATVVFLQALRRPGYFGVIAAPELADDARAEVGSAVLTGGRYRIHLLGRAADVRLRLTGAGPERTVRLAAAAGDQLLGRTEQVTAAGTVQTVLRQRVALPARGLVLVGGAAGHSSPGLMNTRMGACLTTPEAPCEQGGRFAGRLAAGPSGPRDWTIQTFDVDQPAGPADAGAYFYASPTQTSATAVYAVLDLS